MKFPLGNIAGAARSGDSRLGGAGAGGVRQGIFGGKRSSRAVPLMGVPDAGAGAPAGAVAGAAGRGPAAYDAAAPAGHTAKPTAATPAHHASTAVGHPGFGGAGSAPGAPSPVVLQKERTLQKKIISSFFFKLAVVVAVIWATFTFVFGMYQMQGEAMFPAVHDGDVMVFYRLDNNYHPNDVVTYVHDGERYTARVVAMEGDTVDMNSEGVLIINNIPRPEGTFYPTEPVGNFVQYPYTVPQDSYFLLCDFRSGGADSRVLGAVAKRDLDGQVVTILRRRGI